MAWKRWKWCSQPARDVLLLDIVMPRLDGFSTLEQLARLDLPKRPHVIMLTGLTRDDFISRAMRLGADYYMIKPFDMQMLYTRILEVARADDAPVYLSGPDTQTGASVDERVTNLFLSIGIPAHHQGLRLPARGRQDGDGESRPDQPHHEGAVSRHRPPLLHHAQQGGARHAPRN